MDTVMKTLVVALVLLMAGCATQTKYVAAEKRGDAGYTQMRFTDDRYRITFVGNSRTPKETVQDYALLRAAELTLEKGYDWFQIVHRDTARKSQTVAYATGAGLGHEVHRRCGLVSCDAVVTPGTNPGGDVAATKVHHSYSTILEIVLGNDPMPEDVESYDAHELSSTIRRWMEK